MPIRRVPRSRYDAPLIQNLFYDEQKIYHCIKLNQFRFCYSTVRIKSDLILKNKWVIKPIINQ